MRSCCPHTSQILVPPGIGFRLSGIDTLSAVRLLIFCIYFSTKKCLLDLRRKVAAEHELPLLNFSIIELTLILMTLLN